MTTTQHARRTSALATRSFHRAAAAALAVLMLSIALAPTPARGQIPGLGSNDQRPSLTLTIGFNGNYVPERTNPITLTIDDPSPTPTAGTVIITLPQDSTQAADIALRYATTPGTPTSIDFFATISPSFQTIQASFIPDRGRRFATTFTPVPGRRESMLIAQPVTNRPLVVAVGRSFFDNAAAEWQRQARADSDFIGDPPEHTVISSEFAPRDSHAYDAASLVIVGAADQRIDPAARDAIAQHLISGGHVALIATDPSATIEPWIAGLPAPVTLGAPQARAPPPALASIATVRTQIASDANSFAPNRANRPVPGTVAIAPPGSMEIPLAQTITARPITPIDPAWTTRWHWGDERNASPAIIATGPVGFGTLTIIGAPLDRLPEVLSAEHTAALAAVALEHLFVYRPSDHNFWQTRSGANQTAADAISAVGDFLARGTTISLGFLPVLIIAALALALLVGPIDYLLLGKLKLRHRSWLTALAWIAIASTLAAVAPRLIRSGSTNAIALRVVDHTAGFACATELTLISSNDDARVTPPTIAGAVRGVSPTYSFNEARPSLPALPLTPQADTETRLRSLALRAPIRSPLWTARLLLASEAPTQSDLIATVDAASNPPTLSILSLDEGGADLIVNAADCYVDMRGVRYALTESGPGRFTLDRTRASATLPTLDASTGVQHSVASTSTSTTPALGLPGPLARNAAIVQRLRAETHALVTISERREVLGGTLVVAGDTTPLPMDRRTIHRVLVPIERPAESDTSMSETP